MPESLASLVARHTPPDLGGEVRQTAVPALGFFRADALSPLAHALYRASLCVVVQGAKRVEAADAVLDYGAGDVLVVAVDLPLVAQVVQATPDEPYLAAVLDLDPAVLLDVAQHAGVATDDGPPAESALFVSRLPAPAADALARLAELLDRPDAIPVLAPGLVREVCYWLLSGPDGAAFARLARPGGPTRRIAASIRAMDQAFPGPVRVGALAEAAGMSVSSFHAHFRAVTSLAPLQYYKRLRLLEARRLLTAEGTSAREAAFRVGYESPSQFSREYARTFGASPARDAADALRQPVAG